MVRSIFLAMESFRSLRNTSMHLDVVSNIKHMTNDMISDIQRHIITLINYTLLCQVFSLFGCVTNVINLIIFYRQGLTTTINISFFALAISDFCSLVLQEISCIYVNPFFVALNLPMVYSEVQWASARIARVIFARITFFVTVYITVERCLCIAFPLQVKQMITPKKTVLILVSIYVFALATCLPMMGTLYIGWKFHPDRNITLLGVVYRKYKDVGTATTFFCNATLGAIAFVTVVAFTLFLILRLRERSYWRKMANVGQEKSQSFSQRDKATVKMVVCLTGLLIVCYLPSVLLCYVAFIEPEFREDGRFHNAYSSLWSVAMVMENINSSVNIFFYLKMSSRYRQTFEEWLSTCLCKVNGKVT